jgi:hypothetical protein
MEKWNVFGANGSEEVHDVFQQTELTNNRSCVHVISSEWLPLAKIFPI